MKSFPEPFMNPCENRDGTFTGVPEGVAERKKDADQNKDAGRIHSIESFGTVDGPGIRLVVFFQGCPMRCRYCHNPDSWEKKAGTRMTVEEILNFYEKNKSFYRDGGLTATGGEPLLQLPFLSRLFAEAKKRKIHTCLDTSGVLYRESRAGDFRELFDHLDLVLLDIKHSDPEEHERLTGQKQEPVLAFARALERERIPMVVRHVVIPGITDGEKHLKRMGQLLSGFQNLTGLDVLPYHTMGLKKYEALGLPCPLPGVQPMDAEAARLAREIILSEIRKNKDRKLSI